MARPVVAVSETALHYHCRSTTTAHSAGFLVGNGNALLSLCAAAGWRKKCVLFDIRKSMVPPPPFHIFFTLWCQLEDMFQLIIIPKGIAKVKIQLIDTPTKVYAIGARLFLSKVPLEVLQN